MNNSDRRDRGRREEASRSGNKPRYPRIDVAGFRELFGSFVNETKAGNEKSDDRENKKHRTESCTLRLIGIYTGITAVIMVIGAYQAYLSREALTKTQRAYVMIRKIELLAGEKDLQGHAVWEMVPVWENSGDTPTRDLLARVNMTTTEIAKDQRLTGDFWSNDGPSGSIETPIVIGPRSSTAIVFNEPPESTVKGFKEKLSYIWGWATYRDVFDDCHVTRFCWMIDHVRGDPSDLNSKIEMSYSLCATGNCTDDECERQRAPYPKPYCVPFAPHSTSSAP